jgi:helix-turn-helix protein
VNKIIEVVIFPDGRLDSVNAAKYLGLSQKTLAMMRCQGTGPKYIKRGRIFYFNEDLDGWISQAGKRSSTAQRT